MDDQPNTKIEKRREKRRVRLSSRPSSSSSALELDAIHTVQSSLRSSGGGSSLHPSRVRNKLTSSSHVDLETGTIREAPEPTETPPSSAPPIVSAIEEEGQHPERSLRPLTFLGSDNDSASDEEPFEDDETYDGDSESRRQSLYSLPGAFRVARKFINNTFVEEIALEDSSIGSFSTAKTPPIVVPKACLVGDDQSLASRKSKGRTIGAVTAVADGLPPARPAPITTPQSNHVLLNKRYIIICGLVTVIVFSALFTGMLVAIQSNQDNNGKTSQNQLSQEESTVASGPPIIVIPPPLSTTTTTTPRPPKHGLDADEVEMELDPVIDERSNQEKSYPSSAPSKWIPDDANGRPTLQSTFAPPTTTTTTTTRMSLLTTTTAYPSVSPTNAPTTRLRTSSPSSTPSVLLEVPSANPSTKESQAPSNVPSSTSLASIEDSSSPPSSATQRNTTTTNEEN